MSNTPAQLDPLERACALVGRFMYHFGRVEQKIDQAAIKLAELDPKSAPVIALIDFARKLNDLVRGSVYAQTSNAKDKEFAKEVCNRAHDMNNYRRIIAHASFEPAGDGVRFSRAVTTKGEVRPITDPWTADDFAERYEEMRKLEEDLNALILLIKPLPPFGWATSFWGVPPRPTSMAHHVPASTWVPPPPDSDSTPMGGA
jgi:hypothetical protein